MAEQPKTIYEAIMELSAAFSRQGLKPPAAIELQDVEEGHRLMMLMRRDMPASVMPSDLRKAPDNECEIMGVKVRWPRGYRMRPDGTLARPGQG